MASLASSTPLIQPHWECISEQLQQIMLVIGQEAFSQRFYLAGGTALALQLGHRISVDLDFFAPEVWIKKGEKFFSLTFIIKCFNMIT